MDSNTVAAIAANLGLAAYVPAFLAAVGLASAIVALLPAGKPGSVLAKLHTAVSYLALNVGNVRNVAPTAAAATLAVAQAAKVLAVMLLLGGVTLLPLAGCGLLASPTTAATATVSAAQGRLQDAIDLYGVAKGLIPAADLAQPALAAPLAAITALVDPRIVQAQALLNEAATDAAAIDALAVTITGQANALTLQAAPAIKVVPATAS